MEDFLLLDNYLSPEEKLIRDQVHLFVNEKIIPKMADCYEKAIFPKALIPDFAKLGLLGMTLPSEYGGSGSSYTAYGLVCQELERGDSAIRSFVSVQSSLCMYPIFSFGSEAQKKRFLPKMAEGKYIGCFGLTEPDSGSDPSSMKTHAEKTSGGYLLNGTKMWITNAPFADIAIVWAKCENSIRGFIIEREFSGFSTPEIHHKMSLRASCTGEIVLENCFVPDENVLPKAEGLGAALKCLTQARFGIAFGAIGAAIACFDAALEYVNTRKQFGKTLSSFQLIQHDLVDMFNEIVKAQLVNLQLGQLQDQDKATFPMVSLAKMNACREALNISRQARNLLGANGISLEYPVIRHMQNLETVFTYEGTDNIHHLIVGKYLTGKDAFGGGS